MTAISITRALAEVKSLDDRITKAVQAGAFVAVTQGKGERRRMTSTSASIQTVEQSIKSAYTSINDMLNRRKALKAAVIKSNAETTVSIGGVSMTVAEAIERKNSIGLQATFYQFMRKNYIEAANAVTNGNRVLDDQIEKAVVAAYGNDSKNKPSKEAYDAVAEPRRNDHELSLLDPQNITAKIDELAAKLNTFSMEVDFVLSESNARNEIEVAD